MLHLKTVKTIKSELLNLKDKKIALIATMGALHQGHLALIKKAKQIADFVIVSIFINPLQFSPNEDLNKYPKTLENDLELCAKEKANLVFSPSAEEIYPQGQNITKIIADSKLSNCLCGISRPQLFNGVLTIVLKLFNIIKPDIACFGEKDYQQLLIIKKMIFDLNLDIEIYPVEIIRDLDGLALSSRNKYLTKEQRLEALKIPKTLLTAKDLIQKGQNPEEVIKNLWDPCFEYFEARNPETLKKTNDFPLRLFICGHIGNTRLIDNVEI